MKSPRSPLVSVIIVNWNGKGLLDRCLRSLQAQTVQDFEIIVVDNASTDESAENLEAIYPGIRLVRLERNLGFAKANNVGARTACGEWLALLNNDAFPRPDWLEELIKATTQFPGYAVFASRLVQADDPGIMDGSGQIFHISGLSWHRDHGLRIDSDPRPSEEVFSACAAAALYNRQIFISLGGFDEDLENYYEDVDLGFRLRIVGHRCLYVSSAIVEHIGSASFGRESDRSVYYQQRNWAWIFIKNMPGKYLWLYLPVHIFSEIVFFFIYLRRRQGKVFLKAKLDVLTSLFLILQSRKQVQLSRRIEPGSVAAVMDKNILSPYLLGKLGRRVHRQGN